MTKRTRQHQIEDLSRQAFESSLPDEWVYRKLDSDYGIDGQVEIFDKEGNVTGLTFNVQLKATENKKIPDALKCSLKKGTCHYYSRHDLPTLMIRFHVPSNTIYTRWFHQCAEVNIEKDQKSFTFHWQPEDKWTFESSKIIYNSVERFRRLRSPGLHFPVGLLLEKDNCINDQQFELLRMKCKAPPYSNFTHNLNKEDSHKWLLRIHIGEEDTQIELGGLTLRSLHHTNINAHINIESFLCDILTIVGISLCKIGQIQLGAKIVADLIDCSGFLERLESEDAALLSEASRWLAHNGDTEKVLTLAKKMFKKESSYYEGILTSLLIVSKSKALEEKDFNVLIGFMHEKIEEASKENNKRGEATTHYSLGNMMHNRGRNKEALRHYKLASQLQPIYKSKDYFVGELAGVLFDNKRFHCSAKAYQAYFSMADKKETFQHELLADAYMFSGKYDLARSSFREFFNSERGCLSIDGNYEWKLREMFCESIIFEYSCKEQKRMPIKAMKLASKKFDNPIEKEKYLSKTLKLDYLGGLTWFNLGASYLEMEKEEDARDSFLCAALSQRNDIEAWTNALLLTFNLMTPEKSQQEGPLFQAILLAAHKIFRSEFFIQVLSKLPKDAPVSMLVEAMETVCSEFESEAPPQDSKFVVRFFDPNN